MVHPVRGKKWFLLLLAISVALGIGLAAFVLGGPVSAVDWSKAYVVALESDDWGLAGFVPHGGLWQKNDRSILIAGPGFPQVYWESTLEDSTMVRGLCDVLDKHHGADGLPPVFQPNYVMSSLEWEPGEPGLWQRHDLPVFPQQYSRPGMWKAVRDGIDQGLWYPEYHAAWHYDPQLRKQNALENSDTRAITEAGILLFPGSELARELGPWREPQELNDELSYGLGVFAAMFGRPPGSIIAPDYTWDDSHEEMWERHGQVVIQAKREQRNPHYGYGLVSRVRKMISRRLVYLFKPSRTYLERNCRFEPVQHPQRDNPEAMAEMVEGTVRQTLAAWSRGQPAIVETHRVNFAHTNPAVVALGQNQLNTYLDVLLADERGKLAVFLVDMEIAQLYRQGTSVCLRGGEIVVRNNTHSRRVVAVPQSMIKHSAGNAHPKGSNYLILVNSGATEIIPVSSLIQ